MQPASIPQDNAGRRAARLAGRGRWIGLLGSGLAVLLSGCGEPDAPRLPDPLRVAVVPDQARERLEKKYAPLVRYLGDTLGVRAELVIPGTYEELGERFHRGEVDLALFGGVTFVQAERRDGAVPLAMRVIDRHITSIVIAHAGQAGKFPEDFRGRSFLFGAQASTSGQWIPRYFFDQMKLVPEKYFASVTNRPNHDAVVAAIQEGQADAGVVNGLVLRQLIAEGLADPGRFRQVWESPPYADYVWAMPARLPPALRTRLRDAFLSLEAENPEHQKILAPLGARAYVPATRTDFELVRRVVTGKPQYSAHERR